MRTNSWFMNFVMLLESTFMEAPIAACTLHNHTKLQIDRNLYIAGAQIKVRYLGKGKEPFPLVFYA